MKAIQVHQFGAPQVLIEREIPTPTPGPREVLVRVRAAGVNPVETYIRAGTYATLPPLPYTPGKDGAGEVEMVGAHVTSFQPGDRVYLSGSITGTYAQYTLCSVGDLHSLPEHVTFAQGAALNTPYMTAARALFQRAGVNAGETILIHGASGGVGLAAVQFARSARLVVFGTAGTQRGRDLILKHGAHYALDHREPFYLEKALLQTKRGGFDVILEMLANVNLGKDLPALAPRGRVVVIGSRGPVEINARDLMSRDAAVIGMMLGNAADTERVEIFDRIDAGLANRILNPVIGREFPLACAAEAHETVMEPGSYGKIVLIP